MSIFIFNLKQNQRTLMEGKFNILNTFQQEQQGAPVTRLGLDHIGHQASLGGEDSIGLGAGQADE